MAQPKYELVVDYGKPYSEFPKNLKKLKNALLKLKKYAEAKSHEILYMDIVIYKDDKDVTDKIFKKLGFDK